MTNAVIVIGEGMIEVAERPESGWHLGYGGDTLNTAIHLARSGLAVRFASAIGSDPLSARLRSDWEAAGLDCSLVLADPVREPGLYAITRDAEGERNFAYWRGQSAARHLFEHPDSTRLAEEAGRAELLCFSLISLAVLPDAGREALLDIAAQVRAQGGRVAFDGNYRPRLWSSAEQAETWRTRAAGVADIGLPTLSDETMLSGLETADAVASTWEQAGCGEVVVKLGADGCRMRDGRIAPVPRKLRAFDTSGAGDAFNGGYLSGRMRGLDPAAAAARGQALAGWVVMRAGAIPPRDDEAPY
ncbi:sugar kinase [Novosphingobium soli]|uniref:Sugar kinase n=1 Tax=Novosphingobium soli TaxID=574956 RepID=A0ABV6CZG4_9SPHN